MLMVKHLQFLNVGDFETDAIITDFGIKLKDFSGKFNVNENILGINESIDFIDASIIHIIHDIKIDLIALHALKNINGCNDVYHIELINQDVGYSFYKQASEKQVSINNYPKTKSWSKFWMNVYQEFKIRAYLKYRKIKKQNSKIPHNSSVRNTNGRKILFESNYVNSLHTLLPLVKELQFNSDISYHYILIRDRAFKYLDNLRIKGIELIEPSEFGKINVKNLKRFVDEFLEEYYPDISTQYFKKNLLKILLNNLQIALNVYKPLEKVIQEYKPDAVVLCTGSSVDARLLIQLAKNNKIPDYVLVHGLLWDTPVIKFNNASTKFVWSEYQSQMMEKYAPSVKSIIKGSPKHSIVKGNLENGSQKRIIQNRYILYATTPPNNVLLGKHEYEEILKSFASASRRFELLDFVIKLHPSEDISDVKALLHKYDGSNSKVKILKAEDTYNLLYFAEMVMVVSSTTGFEAVYFDKPLIIQETTVKAFHYPFKNEGFVKVVNTTEELVKAIGGNISKEPSRIAANIKAKYFLDNPSATKDILNIIASENK